MKKIVILGASGMIGKIILKHALNSNEVSEVINLVRKRSGNSHPKVQEIVVEDFANFPTNTSILKNIDVAFFCIGVYTGTVPRDEFKTITVDYPVSFAKSLHSTSPQATFCLLSGQGADRKEKSKVAFALDKGIAENNISTLGFKAFHTFRPGYIFPIEPRVEPNFSYKVTRALYPMIKLMGKKFSTTSEELGKSMFNIGLKGGTQEVYENADILNSIHD